MLKELIECMQKFHQREAEFKILMSVNSSGMSLEDLVRADLKAWKAKILRDKAKFEYEQMLGAAASRDL